MKTLIAYASSQGGTKKAVDSLAKKLTDTVEVIDLKKKSERSRINIEDFDRIIIGGSIHVGRIQRQVRNFCSEYLDDLLHAEQLGFFICCGQEDMAEKQLNSAFPPELLARASARGYFGYEYNLEKMNFFSRMMLKKAAGVEESESRLNEENISEFARRMGG